MPDHPFFALVIEDDERLADIFEKALQTAGFETQIIPDGRRAIEVLQSTQPTLVVLDLHLPYVSGQEVLRFIHCEPHLKAVKVILATADPAMAESIEEESDLILIKPISFIQLQTLAQRLVSQS